MPSDGAEYTDELGQKLMKTPEGECTFCPGDAWDWIFVYSLEDYSATNLDEEPPMRLVGVCAGCYDRFNQNSELVEKEEVPGV